MKPSNHNSHMDIPLYSRLEERGFVATVRRVLEKHHRRQQRQKQQPLSSSSRRIEYEDEDKDRNDEATIIEEGLRDDSAPRMSTSLSCSNHVDPPVDERERLLQTILLPLIRSLTGCYQILDAIPQTPPPSPPPQSSSSSSTPPRPVRTTATTNNNKPSPPPGMLSIQQYTDIACLVEFVAWIGILSQLEDYILTPPPPSIGRNNPDPLIQPYHYSGGTLPKSLAGRLPKDSLVWGWWTSRSSRTTMDRRRRQEEDVLLLETTKALSGLLSLDRFRPMLLPRHAPTLYAALFQYEHNNNTTTATTKNAQTQQQEQPTDSLWQTILPVVEQDDTLKARAY